MHISHTDLLSLSTDGPISYAEWAAARERDRREPAQASTAVVGAVRANPAILRARMIRAARDALVARGTIERADFIRAGIETADIDRHAQDVIAAVIAHRPSLAEAA